MVWMPTYVGNLQADWIHGRSTNQVDISYGSNNANSVAFQADGNLVVYNSGTYIFSAASNNITLNQQTYLNAPVGLNTSDVYCNNGTNFHTPKGSRFVMESGGHMSYWNTDGSLMGYWTAGDNPPTWNVSTVSNFNNIVNINGLVVNGNAQTSMGGRFLHVGSAALASGNNFTVGIAQSTGYGWWPFGIIRSDNVGLLTVDNSGNVSVAGGVLAGGDITTGAGNWLYTNTINPPSGTLNIRGWATVNQGINFTDGGSVPVAQIFTDTVSSAPRDLVFRVTQDGTNFNYCHLYGDATFACARFWANEGVPGAAAGYSFSGNGGSDTGMFSVGDGDVRLLANNVVVYAASSNFTTIYYGSVSHVSYQNDGSFVIYNGSTSLFSVEGGNITLNEQTNLNAPVIMNTSDVYCNNGTNFHTPKGSRFVMESGGHMSYWNTDGSLMGYWTAGDSTGVGTLSISGALITTHVYANQLNTDGIQGWNNGTVWINQALDMNVGCGIQLRGSTATYSSSGNYSASIFHVISQSSNFQSQQWCEEQVGTEIRHVIYVNSQGGTSSYFRFAQSGRFDCGSTYANYADVAELYVAKEHYVPGTFVKITYDEDVDYEVDEAVHGDFVFGVISTEPGLLINSKLRENQIPRALPVALTGRVPTLVSGPIRKGHPVTLSEIPGVGKAGQHRAIGFALETNLDVGIKLVEVAIGGRV